MKSYLGLVREYAKVHRKKNRVTILCVAVAVCLVTAIFGMADMEIRAQKISTINEYGNYHVDFKNINNDTGKLIGSRSDVEVSGWIHAIKSGVFKDKKLAIIGGEEAISCQLGLNVVKGYFPNKLDEALLDRPAMDQFDISLGDNISITLPDGKTKNLTIVGVYSDFSSLKTADAHGVVLSDEGIRKFSDDGSRGDYYVQFKKGINMQKAITEIKENYNLADEQVSENIYLMGLAGQSSNSFMIQLYSVAGVLFILVLIAGVLMIASSFNMSVLERIQFFGLLRCLGASKKQIKRFVLLEGLNFSIKGIPIGLLSGTIILWAASAFLKYVNPTFFKDMPQFGVSWPSLLAGIVVGLLSVILASLSPCKKAAKVSPSSAVTGNINHTNIPQSKTAVKITGRWVDISMGIYHAFASKKNILLMASSFAISIILFLAFSVSIDFMHKAIKPLSPATPDVSIISKDNICLLDTTLLENIKKIPEVKQVYGRMFAYDVPITSSQGEKSMLISYEKNQFQWAKKELVKGNIDEVEKGSDSVLTVYSKDLNWKVGDFITLKFPSGEKKVKIAGILSSVPFSYSQGEHPLICSEKVFKELTGEEKYTIVDMKLSKSADDNTISKIRSLATSQITLSDRRQNNIEAKSLVYTYGIFIYGFLVIITSITVFNIINSMNTSVSSRMNQYGVMRAVGMSGKQLHRLVFAEASAYAACGCLTGICLGLPFHRFIFHKMVTFKWGTEWQPPYTALLFIIIIVILTTILSAIGPVKKINKMDIVNVVNGQ